MEERLSHPTWVRGLKPFLQKLDIRNTASHPTWVRGLKLDNGPEVCADIMSHPTWVRGLKLPYALELAQKQIVAPYVGAWIETAMARERHSKQ